VAGHPALLLRNPPYPAGGIHGGHLTVLFNAGGAGYAVTGHPVGAGRAGASPGPRARARALTALVVVAASMW
jgi:hypothetical protein